MKLIDRYRARQRDYEVAQRQRAHQTKLSRLASGQSMTSKDGRTRWDNINGTIYIYQLDAGKWSLAGFED